MDWASRRSYPRCLHPARLQTRPTVLPNAPRAMPTRRRRPMPDEEPWQVSGPEQGHPALPATSCSAPFVRRDIRISHECIRSIMIGRAQRATCAAWPRPGQCTRAGRSTSSHSVRACPQHKRALSQFPCISPCTAAVCTDCRSHLWWCCMLMPLGQAAVLRCSARSICA